MDFHKKDAIYLQIVEMVCENIINKRWEEGEKIPSVRELAVSVEVNPNTVMRSYTYLQERDIIHIKRGIGYFVSENAYTHTVKIMRTNFIRNDLPIFFKTIKLLNMDFEELKERFAQYEREKDENKS
jgi:GntR family transcriptional regulator